jgi:hypothetical protein
MNLDQLLLDTTDDLDKLLLDTSTSIPLENTSFQMTDISTELNEIQGILQKQKQQQKSLLKHGSVDHVNRHNKILMLKPSEYENKSADIIETFHETYIVSYDNTYLRFKDVPTFKGFSKTKFLKKRVNIPIRDPLTGQTLLYPVHPVTGQLIKDQNEYNVLLNSLSQDEKQLLKFKKESLEIDNVDFLQMKQSDPSDQIFFDKQLGGWVIPGERSWMLDNDILTTRPVYGNITREIPRQLKIRCVNKETFDVKQDMYIDEKIQTPLTRENFNSIYKIYKIKDSNNFIYNNLFLNIHDLPRLYTILTTNTISEYTSTPYIDESYKNDTSLSSNQKNKLAKINQDLNNKKELAYIYGIYQGENVIVKINNNEPVIVRINNVLKQIQHTELYLKDTTQVDYFILDSNINKVYSLSDSSYLSNTIINGSNHQTQIPYYKTNLDTLPLDPDTSSRLPSYDLNQNILEGRVYAFIKEGDGQGLYCKIDSIVPKMVEITAPITRIVTKNEIQWDKDGPKLKNGDYKLDIHMKSRVHYLIRLDNSLEKIQTHKLQIGNTLVKSQIFKEHFMYVDGYIKNSTLKFEVVEYKRQDKSIVAKVLLPSGFKYENLEYDKVQFSPEFIKVNTWTHTILPSQVSKSNCIERPLQDGSPIGSPDSYYPDSPSRPDSPYYCPESPSRIDLDLDVDKSLYNDNYDNYNDNNDNDNDNEMFDDDDDSNSEKSFSSEQESTEPATLQPEQEYAIGYNHLAQLDKTQFSITENQLDKDQKDALKIIRKIMTLFKYSLVLDSEIIDLIDAFGIFSSKLLQILKLNKLERQYTQDPKTMMLILMCYNLIVSRQVITLNEYLSQLVYIKFKGMSKPKGSIVTLDKINITYVWKNLHSIMSIDVCSVYKEKNISNLDILNDYTKYINNIICFLIEQGFVLYSSSTMHIPSSIPIGSNKRNYNYNNDKYEVVDNTFIPKTLQSKNTYTDKNNLSLLSDWGINAIKQEPEQEPSVDSKGSIILKRRLRDSIPDRYNAMDIEPSNIQIRPSVPLDTLIQKDMLFAERKQQFDDIIKESMSSKKQKISNTTENEQDRKLNDIIQQSRQHFADIKTQLDNLDLALLSQQDKQDLFDAEHSSKPNQIVIQAKFDKIINTNYSGPEYKNLRELLYNKQDDIDFITGKTTLDANKYPDADAAKRLLVLFYKAIKQNSNKYNELQKRRQVLLERIYKDRTTRQNIDSVYQKYQDSLDSITNSQSNTNSNSNSDSDSDSDSVSSDTQSDNDTDTDTDMVTNTTTQTPPKPINIFMPRKKTRQSKKKSTSSSDLTRERLQKLDEYYKNLTLQKRTDLDKPKTRDTVTNKWTKFKK